MAKRKTKRVVAWAITNTIDPSLDGDITYRERAAAKKRATLRGDRVAKLREVTPAEEAVLRAARAYVAGGDWGTEDALVRAVERMEKDDE